MRPYLVEYSVSTIYGSSAVHQPCNCTWLSTDYQQCNCTSFSTYYQLCDLTWLSTHNQECERAWLSNGYQQYESSGSEYSLSTTLSYLVEYYLSKYLVEYWIIKNVTIHGFLLKISALLLRIIWHSLKRCIMFWVHKVSEEGASIYRRNSCIQARVCFHP